MLALLVGFAVPAPAARSVAAATLHAEARGATRYYDAPSTPTTVPATPRVDATRGEQGSTNAPRSSTSQPGRFLATKAGGGVLSRLGARLADETGAIGRYGNLGNLADRADETVVDVIRSRGGGASQVNQLQTGYGQLTLGEISDLAASGDREAIRAIKMAKQAGSQGNGGF